MCSEASAPSTTIRMSETLCDVRCVSRPGFRSCRHPRRGVSCTDRLSLGEISQPSHHVGVFTPTFLSCSVKSFTRDFLPQPRAVDFSGTDSSRPIPLAPSVQEQGRQACIQTGEERQPGRSDRHYKRGTSRRPASAIGYADDRAHKKADHRHRRLLLGVTTAANSMASAFRDGLKEAGLIASGDRVPLVENKSIGLRANYGFGWRF
jgi:hypothetical protein